MHTLLPTQRLANPRDLYRPHGIPFVAAAPEGNCFGATNADLLLAQNTGTEFETLHFELPGSDADEFDHELEPGALAGIWFGTSAPWCWPDGSIRFRASSDKVLLAVVRHDP